MSSDGAGVTVDVWLKALLLPLLDKPDELRLDTSRPHPESETAEVIIHCAKTDVGRVVGKHNNTINALRILTRAWAGRYHHEVIVRVAGHVDPLSSLTARS